jgi:hypothetical protein
LVLKEQERLEERLRKLESASGLIAVKDELKKKRGKIGQEFSEGEGI